jgi:hypothetical protein
MAANPNLPSTVISRNVPGAFTANGISLTRPTITNPTFTSSIPLPPVRPSDLAPAATGPAAGGVLPRVLPNPAGLIGGVLVRGALSILGGLFGGGGGGGTLPNIGFKGGHPYSGYPGILSPLGSTGGVIWPYRPSIEVARNVNYENTTPTHSMQDFRSFRNNSSANITVSGNFSAQTIEEGQYMQAALHFFRVATLMSFGRGGAVPAGMPPPVLSFSAYGQNNLSDLPVVLDSVLQSYPPDVDYIDIGGNQVPTVMTITAVMTVMLAPEQLREFNLDAFAAGSMQNYV